MTKPLISICVPTYNQTKFLEELLLSLKKQDFDAYELIISDDSSTDDVEKLVCGKYGQFFHKKLKYKRNSPGLGSPGNWNAAIALAESNIIKLIHHDEFFTFPYSLRRFYEVCINHGPQSVVFSGGFTLDYGRQETRNHSANPFQVYNTIKNPELLLFSNTLGSPGGLCYWKNDIDYDVKLKWLVDVEFYVRLIKKYKLVYIDETLVSTVINAEHNVTNECENNMEVEIPEYAHIYRKFRHLGYLNPFNFMWYLKNTTALMYKYGIFSLAELKAIPNQGHWPKMFTMAAYCARLRFVRNNRL